MIVERFFAGTMTGYAGKLQLCGSCGVFVKNVSVNHSYGEIGGGRSLPPNPPVSSDAPSCAQHNRALTGN